MSGLKPSIRQLRETADWLLIAFGIFFVVAIVMLVLSFVYKW